MKIFLVSDLHLEGQNYKAEFPKADIAILAGDICVASGMDQEYIRKFFRKVSNSFDRAYYVPGNHEYYHSIYGPAHDVGYTEKHINTFTADRTIPHLLQLWGITNIKFMNRHTDIIDGVKFIGATLWTDYFKGNPLEMQKAEQGMADFGLIAGFSPTKAYEEHLKSRAFIKAELKNAPQDMMKVVITHHGPTLQSIHPIFRDPQNGYLNASFTSDCSELFAMEEFPRYWFHGHTHEAMAYRFINTSVLVNPRGYRGEFQNDAFDPNLVIELCP